VDYGTGKKFTFTTIAAGTLDLILLPFLFLFSLLARLSRLGRSGNKPRIFFGTMRINHWYYLVRRLREKGYKASLIVWRVDERETDFPYDEVITRDHAKAFTNPLTRYLFQFFFFCRIIWGYDVLIMCFMERLIDRTELARWLELPLIKLSGARIILNTYGGDVMTPQMTLGDKNYRYSVLTGYESDPYYKRLDERKVATNRGYCEYWADEIISAIDHVEYLQRVDHYLHLRCVDTSEMSPLYETGNKPLKIIHAPNHPLLKGTAYLQKAVGKLQAEGLPVILEVAEHMKYKELLEKIRQADIVADQFVIGAYSRFAIEGMAFGKPVLCYLRDNLFQYNPIWRESPIVNTQPEEIEENLRQLINDAVRRKELGKKGREYVEKYHSIEYVESRLEDIIEKTWNGRKAICFFILDYFPVLGGTERQAQTVAEKLAASGKEVFIVCRKNGKGPFRDKVNGISVYRLPVIWWPLISWLSLLVTSLPLLLFKIRRIGVLQGFMLSVPSYLALVYGRLFRKPVVIKLSAGGKGGNIQTARMTMQGQRKLTFVAGQADYLVSINREIKKELLDMGVNERKIKVIPNGVDTGHFRPVGAEEKELIRKKLGLAGKKVALFVGRLDQVKNIDQILVAWQTVSRKISPACLVIVGSGPEEKTLKDLAALPASGNVIFTGAGDPREYYQAADVFILSSTREGMANALLEALACGLPAIVSPVGGNLEIVKEKINGFFAADAVALADRINDILTDRAKFVPAEVTASIENFSLEKVSTAYGDIYAAAMSPNFKKIIPVLAYHRVVKKIEFGMDVSEKDFEEQLTWLKGSGWKSLTLSDLAGYIERKEPVPEKSVIFTFDDGHLDNYEIACPLLKKYGYTATVFLTAAYLGRTKYVRKRDGEREWLDKKPASWDEQDKVNYRKFDFLSWDQAAEMLRDGFSIGGHTLTHPELTKLTAEQKTAEIKGGKELIENKLGIRIEHFCYPYQDYNEEVINMVKRAGFRTASYSPSPYQMLFYWDDPYQLERIGVFSEVGRNKFRLMVNGNYFRARKNVPPKIWETMRRIKQG